MPIWNQVAHNLLSATHRDTTAATVTRGAIPTGQAATPTWQLLSLGASGTILRSNGTDILYSTATFPNTVTSGDVLIATGANAIGSLAIGATGTIIRSTGTAPAYTTATYPNTVTSGSILFATGTNAIGENNANFFWDNTNNRLGIGTTAPNSILSFGQPVVKNEIYLHDGGADKYGFGVQSSQLLIYSGAAGISTGGILFGKFDGTTFTENVRFQNGGNVGIGTTSPLGIIHTVTTTGTGLVQFDQYTTDANPVAIRCRKARNTVASPQAVAASDFAFIVDASFHDGTAFAVGARIGSIASEAWTSTAHGTRLVFNTTAIGTTTLTERMGITDAGVVQPSADVTYDIGAATLRWRIQRLRSLVILSTAALTEGSVGTLVGPVNAGAATDALAGNISGAMMTDTTNNKWWVRVGATWKGVGVAGLSIPNYEWIPQLENNEVVGYEENLDKENAVNETVCPLCSKQMVPDDMIGLVADKWYNGKDNKEGLHALFAHMKCVMQRVMEREKPVTAS